VHTTHRLSTEARTLIENRLRNHARTIERLLDDPSADSRYSPDEIHRMSADMVATRDVLAQLEREATYQALLNQQYPSWRKED
jgi:hypothetical protein